MENIAASSEQSAADAAGYVMRAAARGESLPTTVLNAEYGVEKTEEKSSSCGGLANSIIDSGHRFFSVPAVSNICTTDYNNNSKCSCKSTLSTLPSLSAAAA